MKLLNKITFQDAAILFVAGMLIFKVFFEENTAALKVDALALRISDKNVLIENIDSVINARLRTNNRIQKQQISQMLKAREQQNEVDKTNDIDSLIRLYVSTKPDSFKIGR